jgi:O-antigen ligase
LALPALVALVWTGARMAWIAFAGSVLLYAFFKNKKLIPVFIVLGLMCIPVIPQSIYRRLLSINLNDTSISYRFDIYKTVLPMLKDVWTTGVGLGTDTFMKICDTYFLYTKKVPPHAHNIFLQIWLEIGLAGIIAFVWFIVRIVKKCIINICDKSDKFINNILIAAVAGTAGILFMGLSEYIWYYPRVMIVFWTVIGVVLAALSISNRKREGISQKSL